MLNSLRLSHNQNSLMV